MTTQTARQHASTAANRSQTAEHAEADARTDRQTATTAPTAGDAQAAADNSTRAAITARDAAAAAEYHAQEAGRAMDDATTRAANAIADDARPAQDEAAAAEDAWIDAKRSATHARLCSDLAARHAAIAQETAKTRRLQEDAASKRALHTAAADATEAAIQTGHAERNATAALLDAGVLFRHAAARHTNEQHPEIVAALLRLQCAAISLGDAVEAHAAALLVEQDAYDRLPCGTTHTTSKMR